MSGAGAGAAAGAGAGAAAAGAGAAALGASSAPSQPGAAVAGVQPASRQHSSLVPFFQIRLPWPLRQLSELIVEPAAKAEPATVATANMIATLFSFFMVLLMGKKAAAGLR